jgi:hypothetical protein
MGIGDDVKMAADFARETLGCDCLLNGTTPLGKCAVEVLDRSRIRTLIGEDNYDEVDLAWMHLEAPAETAIKQQDEITVVSTGRSWIVRNLKQTTCGETLIAYRCVCVAKTV